jgi:hypothetical protein
MSVDSGVIKDEAFRRVANIAFDALHAQRMFIERDKWVLMDPAGSINGKALGYVFGFLDALLQSSKLDIRDTEGRATMLSLLGRLFPAENAKGGTFVIHLCNYMSSDPEILNGVMLGGKQAVDWLRHRAPPVRWATCFSKELERMAAERDKKRL